MATTVLVIAGAPGVGKTSVAAVVAARLDAPLLDLDDLAPLPDEPPPHDRSARYAILERAAADAVAADVPHVVLVAPFTEEISSPTHWDAFRARLRPAEVRLCVLLLDEPTRTARLATRGAARDARHETGHTGAGPRQHPNRCHPAIEAPRLDASQPASVSADVLLASLTR